MKVAKIGAVNECKALLWEIQASWNKAEGERKDGVPCPTFPESISVGTWMCARLEACPSGRSSRTSKWAFFTERLGVCFSLLSAQCPGGGVCQELSL